MAYPPREGIYIFIYTHLIQIFVTCVILFTYPFKGLTYQFFYFFKKKKLFIKIYETFKKKIVEF